MQEAQKRPYALGAHALHLPDGPCKILRLRLSATTDDDVASAIVPPVTVVLEGRSICHRIHLSRHTGYNSLAVALRCLFVGDGDDEVEKPNEEELDLSNAVPGHVVAYEDMEDDLLLAGDLSWRDFVRVVKRIRIIPVKPNRRRHHYGYGDV
ncbi:Auxin-responsive protein [Rhynchospora pubera]|uniref:Auxin-responsive protein n=1 Tax=Rhynchospora pubera TaxID=906938 RepID=A0AAV8D4J3_9POAL|nr:Auxin-responsive protein [Rhynchospora pubera]KAJ4813812.1 Auxin-responsive protein [Rhynchospora pubera]